MNTVLVLLRLIINLKFFRWKKKPKKKKKKKQLKKRMFKKNHDPFQ